MGSGRVELKSVVMADPGISSSAPPDASTSAPSAKPHAEPAPRRRRVPASEKLVDFLKTLSWVAPLTILIWIYAEREQSLSLSGVSFPIEVRTTDGSRIVKLLEPSDYKVIVTLSGPRSNVERVSRELQTGASDRAAVQIFIDPKLPRGDNPLETARYIANNPVFTREGISVKEISPRTLRVDIDDFEVRTLEVKVPPNLPNVQDVRFIPATVKVKAPSRVFTDSKGALFVTADLAKLDVLNQPGHHDLAGIPVTPAFKGERVDVEPQAVSVSLEVMKPKADTEVEGIAIFPRGPLPVLNGYKIDVKPLIVPRIRVQGPPDQIKRLENKELSPIAVLDLTSKDAESGGGERSLRFEFPPDAKDVKVVSDPFFVTFTLTERPKE